MKLPAISPKYQKVVAILSLPLAAEGLYIGATAEAGDFPSFQVRWLTGLVMFACGVWLFSKYNLGNKQGSKHGKR